MNSAPQNPKSPNYAVGPTISVSKWLFVAVAVRLMLMLLIHFSGAEKSMSLTRDAFLYDEVGVEIAEHYNFGGSTAWPSRVRGVGDFGWEHSRGSLIFKWHVQTQTRLHFCPPFDC